MNIPPDNTDSVPCRRHDHLTAQRVDVGLVFLKMLGAPDAADYLAQCKIPPAVSDRVLIKGGVRQRDDGCRSSRDTPAQG